MIIDPSGFFVIQFNLANGKGERIIAVPKFRMFKTDEAEIATTGALEKAQVIGVIYNA